jgi:hypothetical protein
MKKEKKYSIVLFCNKKRVRVLYSCMKRTTVYEYWREYRTQVKPRFTKQQTGTRKNKDLIYELALIFPNNRWATDVWVKDSLGRNQKAKIENDKFRIKEIISYWKEELVYDYNTKKRIRYNQVLDYILTINDIAQIFTLNKNLFVQIENDVRLFGNKNKNDANRLLELLREDILNKKKGNFFFVKDITTHQRRLLYKLLESKGFNKNDLFRHYSY